MSYIDEMLTNAQQTVQPQPDPTLPTSLNDPRMQVAKDYVAQHGGNPKAAFYQLCQERMLNPAVIFNKLMGR